MISALQKLTSTGEELYAKICTVHRVDKSNKCCDVIPIDGSAELFEVPFHPNETDEGLCLHPVVNSHVLVVFINKHHACICQVSEVDLMKLTIDQTEFSMDKEGVNLKKGTVKFSINESGFLFKKEKESLKQLMTDLVNAIQAMVFVVPPASPTPSSTTTLMNTATFTALQTRFNSFLKDE